MTDFALKYDWKLRSDPYPVDEERLVDSPLLLATLERFMSQYKGIFRVPVEGGELEFWFDFDLMQAWDQLPTWLGHLASRPRSEAALEMASQGTMIALVAKRDGERITLRAQSILPEPNLPSYLKPITVPASAFLGEWVKFLTAVLEALAEFEPRLLTDSDWLAYRAAIMDVMRHE